MINDTYGQAVRTTAQAIAGIRDDFRLEWLRSGFHRHADDWHEVMGRLRTMGLSIMTPGEHEMHDRLADPVVLWRGFCLADPADAPQAARGFSWSPDRGTALRFARPFVPAVDLDPYLYRALRDTDALPPAKPHSYLAKAIVSKVAIFASIYGPECIIDRPEELGWIDIKAVQIEQTRSAP